MRTVAQYFLPAEAHIPLSKLQSAGIHATLRDEATLQMNWLWSQAVGGVRIDVPDEEYESALDILDLHPTESSLLDCPQCGSPDITIQTVGLVNALAILIINAIMPSRKVSATCRHCDHRFSIDRVTGKLP